MRTIILITSCFPYRPGEEFLEAELPYLASHFDRVVIVPRAVAGMPRKVPPRVEIATDLAATPPIRTIRKFVRLGRHPGLCRDALIRGACKPRGMRKAIAAAYAVATWQEWFSSFLTQRIGSSESVLLYSYWTTLPILAVKLASKGRQHIVGVVSKAHGYDLYVGERGDPSWPFHERILESLDRLFVVSEHGRRYVTSRYPWMAAKTEVSRLGVDDYSVKEASATPKPFLVCSCSYLIPLKRIDILIRALGLVVTEIPSANIEWHHFGDGPLRAELEQLVCSSLPKNVTVAFHGDTINAEVRSFYRDNFINVFVNTSSSEGVPVSIMEAQCAGIPVIATAVGGTPELVNAANGLLLPPNPEAADVAAAIASALRAPACWLEKRNNARQTWQSLANAADNYPSFMRRLSQFFDRPEIEC